MRSAHISRVLYTTNEWEIGAWEIDTNQDFELGFGNVLECSPKFEHVNPKPLF